MPTVYLKKDSGGKVLLTVGAKVALGTACCCGCPPEASHMEGTWSVSGSVAACHDHAIDISFTASGSFSADIATEDCCLAVADGTSLEYTCPEDCGISVGSEPELLDYQIHVCWDGETWSLTLIGEMGIHICGDGNAGIIQDFALDLGSDPSGTHHVEVDSNNGNAHWIFDIVIS